MNCLIYLRVSTKEQAQTDENEGYSIPAQREACLKYIRERDWNFVDEYVDRGESARSADRPELQGLLSRIKKDLTIDALIVHKIDRLARNLEDHVSIKTILQRRGVELFSVVENIEATPSGRLIEGIHALMAEFYSANLASEVKKGMRQKAKQGVWPGKPPIGYINEKVRFESREIAKIAIDPERAPFIKLAFDLYATGDYSLAHVRDILDKKGLRTLGTARWPSRPINKSTMGRILQNPFYIGKMIWTNIEIEGTHEPLIDKATFARVQEIMKVHFIAGEKTRKYKHYLKGTVYCGECGSRMSLTIAKGQYQYFYCLGQSRRNGCRQRYAIDYNLEKLLEDYYKTIQLPRE